MIESIILLLNDPANAEKFKFKKTMKLDEEDTLQIRDDEDEMNKQKDLNFPLEGAP